MKWILMLLYVGSPPSLEVSTHDSEVSCRAEGAKWMSADVERAHAARSFKCERR